MKRLLITGAAGGLGSAARRHMAGFAQNLRLSDVAGLGEAAENEEIVHCDLGDAQAVMDLVKGCDGIVHFGGISVERDFESIMNANLRGVFNLYEAVRAHGKPRVFFASSNHAIGFYPTDQRLDADVPPIADGLYGASKVYGEQLALFYWHKFGIETARVRIGSCLDAPQDRRMLSTWMSFRDMFNLVERVFEAPRLGCPVVYGVSANSDSWWDNSKAGYLGWQPQDSSDRWRAALEASEPAGDPDAFERRYQGGGFTTEPIHSSRD